jgi:hypothetical protein
MNNGISFHLSTGAGFLPSTGTLKGDLEGCPKNMKAPAGCLRLSSYFCHENIAIFASFWGMPLRTYIQFIHEWTKEICGTATSA